MGVSSALRSARDWTARSPAGRDSPAPCRGCGCLCAARPSRSKSRKARRSSGAMTAEKLLPAVAAEIDEGPPAAAADIGDPAFHQLEAAGRRRLGIVLRRAGRGSRPAPRARHAWRGRGLRLHTGRGRIRCGRARSPPAPGPVPAARSAASRLPKALRPDPVVAVFLGRRGGEGDRPGQRQVAQRRQRLIVSAGCPAQRQADAFQQHGAAIAQHQRAVLFHPHHAGARDLHPPAQSGMKRCPMPHKRPAANTLPPKSPHRSGDRMVTACVHRFAKPSGGQALPMRSRKISAKVNAWLCLPSRHASHRRRRARRCERRPARPDRDAGQRRGEFPDRGPDPDRRLDRGALGRPLGARPDRPQPLHRRHLEAADRQFRRATSSWRSRWWRCWASSGCRPPR